MNKIFELQRKIAEVNKEYWDDPDVSRLLFSENAGLYHIVFCGQGYDDDPQTPLVDVDEEDNYPYLSTLEFLAENSDSLSSLTFRGPDEGANGVRNWNFTRLIRSKCEFSQLRSFEVELTDPGSHNLSCISSVENGYEEGGMVASLVSKMPRLENLVIPSAPNKDFFKVKLPRLQSLRIEAGFSPEEFLANFAASSGFPSLSSFDYSEVSFISDKQERLDLSAKFDDFKILFESRAFQSIKHFTLRNTFLTVEELKELLSIRADLQFLIVTSIGGTYVSHM